MTVFAALADTAARVTAAGARATANPADAYAPCVLIYATGIDADGFTGAPGCYVVDVDAEIRPGSSGADALAWAWDTALPAVLAAVGAERVDAETGDDGLPVLIVRTQIKTT